MAKKKIDPLNRKQYGAVSAALTVSDIPLCHVSGNGTV